MITLTYDFEKPETGDKGDVFFPALEDNVQKLNDHTHNGVNSAKITSASVTKVTQTVLAAGWVAQGGGTYKQNIAMPGSMLYDDYAPQVKLSSGHIVHPTIEKGPANTIDIYVNDNTLTLTIVF